MIRITTDRAIDRRIGEMLSKEEERRYERERYYELERRVRKLEAMVYERGTTEANCEAVPVCAY